MRMTVLLALLSCHVPLALAASLTSGDVHLSKDLDMLDELSETEFEEYFHDEPITDKKEFRARAEALKEEEEQIKEVNAEYLRGNSSYYEGLNKYSDLTADEFRAQRTGLGPTNQYGRGLILPPPEERYEDPVDEAWFDRLRFDMSELPASYSSVDQGWVTGVRSQQTCGSCAAFTAVAAVEICFAKLTGVRGDYSEQQLMDCGKGYKNEAHGCEGASGPQIYLQFLNEENFQLAHESKFPYKNKEGECPSNLEGYNQGARVSGDYSTYKGDEELLKKLVYNHGSAAAVFYAAHSAFENYKGGIFTGCSDMGGNFQVDHAITVVGYGTEAGQDYWLIKNSWGKDWGEDGFARILRGSEMCGIGTGPISAVTCEATAGPTDAPLTTKFPCLDSLANDMSDPCPEYAKSYCWWKEVQEKCTKSCGLCPGMTPATSYSCYDTFNNCADLCDTEDASKCKKSCGGCVKPTPISNIKPTPIPTSKPTPQPTTKPTTKPTTRPTTRPTTKPTTAPSVTTQISNTQTQDSCKCTSFVDSDGYGNCQKTYNGKALCYVETPSTCSHAYIGGFSFEACSGSKTPPQGSCKCTSEVDWLGYGNCGKVHWLTGKADCYVETPSTCRDLSFMNSSYEACQGSG